MKKRIYVLINKVIKLARIAEKGNIGLYTAQAAFFTILSAVPFLMLSAVVINKFADIRINELILPMLRLLPAEVSSYAAEIIDEAVAAAESVTAISVTALSVLWSSSRGTAAIYKGLNSVFGEEKKQSRLRARLVSFGWNILSVTSAAVILLVFVAADKYFSELFNMKLLWFFSLAVAAVAAIYTYLPLRKNKFQKQLPGAAVCVASAMLSSFLISVYIRFFPRVSFLYGSLTALALLMLWIYFGIYAFLLGAVINKFREICEDGVKKVKKI